MVLLEGMIPQDLVHPLGVDISGIAVPVMLDQLVRIAGRIVDVGIHLILVKEVFHDIDFLGDGGRETY